MVEAERHRLDRSLGYAPSWSALGRGGVPLKAGDKFLLPVEFRFVSKHSGENITFVRVNGKDGSANIPLDDSITLIPASRIADLEADVARLQAQVDKFEDLYDAEAFDAGKLAEALVHITYAQTLSEARRLAQEALDEDARSR